VTNCYFCHRPVFDQDVQISVRAPLMTPRMVPDTYAIERPVRFELVEHYAHHNCLQSAARNFHPQEQHAQASA
jgi:hypothetical protein